MPTREFSTGQNLSYINILHVRNTGVCCDSKMVNTRCKLRAQQTELKTNIELNTRFGWSGRLGNTWNRLGPEDWGTPGIDWVPGIEEHPQPTGFWQWWVLGLMREERPLTGCRTRGSWRRRKATLRPTTRSY